MAAPTAALAALLCLLLPAAGLPDAVLGRRLLIRPMPQGPDTCRNTLQGPWFMADDRGRVCAAKELDYSTGCCAAGELHHCSMCSAVDSCCESLEHCVSCCMAPGNKPEERRKATLRAPNNPSSGVWPDTFDYCLAACRTHGRSTNHENRYIGPRHHCFSKLGKPLLSPPLPPGALDGVTVLMGAAGSSCTAACREKSLVCSQQHLHLLNTCDQLREVVNCEAGCEAEQFSATMPSAVDPDAPKEARPALCLVGLGSPAAAAFSCDATAEGARRLCPCGARAGAAAPAAAAGADGVGAQQVPPEQQQQQQPGQTAGDAQGAAAAAAAAAGPQAAGGAAPPGEPQAANLADGPQ